MLRLGLAVALLLLFVPAAAAQTSDTRNRALIVLDASKSMNEDAGNGGTRLDAAKQAVDALVDRLPAGAPLGLRVYGSKVSEVSRAEGCKDTELTVPVGPLDKDALRSTVNGLAGKGRTPIGRSLLAVPDDLGTAGGPAQRRPGHRRRRQLRAARSLQGGRGGGQARRRDVDLGRRLPGQ